MNKLSETWQQGKFVRETLKMGLRKLNWYELKNLAKDVDGENVFFVWERVYLFWI